MLVSGLLWRTRALERELTRLRLEVARQRETEARLARSEARGRAVLESALDALLTVDELGQVLELNAVATTAQLADVRPAMAQMLAFSDFTDGNRYTDYVPGSDRSSGYGVAAVVAGGVVTAKAVGTKGFVAILIAAKKILLAIGLAIAGFFKAIWSRLRRLTGRRDAAAPSPPAGADGDDA